MHAVRCRVRVVKKLNNNQLKCTKLYFKVKLIEYFYV